jgi:hypothetical protein
MASLFHPITKHIGRPSSVLLDIQELHNWMLMGAPIYLFTVESRRTLERMPKRLIQHHNGKRLIMDVGFMFLHDLGFEDPTFNANLGSRSQETWMFTCKEDIQDYLITLNQAVLPRRFD